MMRYFLRYHRRHQQMLLLEFLLMRIGTYLAIESLLGQIRFTLQLLELFLLDLHLNLKLLEYELLLGSGGLLRRIAVVPSTIVIHYAMMLLKLLILLGW